MYEANFRPKLRPIDIVPLPQQQGRKFLLRDPLGYGEKHLVVGERVLPLLGLMDGSHDLRDLQVAASRAWGELVFMDTIVQLVGRLDKCLFLDSPYFQQERRRREEEFARQRVRRSPMAGQGYPARKEELEAFLESLFVSHEGDVSCQGEPPRVLIAPHIDLRLGGRAFVAAYSAWRNLPPGSRVVILGTGHYLDGLFAFTYKDFETPLGVARTDGEFLRALEEATGLDLRAREWFHRREHSVELQVLFLQYLMGEAPFTIVPVLCGGITPEKSQPWEDREFGTVVSALKGLLDDRTYLVAGVDFCHLGTRYGDSYPARSREADLALAHDKRLWEAILAREPRAFLEKALEGGNPYKVCGVAPLFVLLSLLEGRDLEGGLFLQDVAYMDEGSLVSFSAGGFWDRG